VLCPDAESELFIDNLLVRLHFIIVMIRWTGLAPWEQVGDIVLCPGKWANEDMVALVEDTQYSTPCTLHPTPCTLHPTPYTPNPKPLTLNPTP